MSRQTPLTVAYGEPIGPENTETPLQIIATITPAKIPALRLHITAARYDLLKTKPLRTLHGQQRFTRAQGQ